MFKKLFVLLMAIVAATTSVRAADKEVKIGFISAFTGVFSSFGQQQKQGAVLALEEANYTAGGDKISVIYEDDQLDNEQAVTKAKKPVTVKEGSLFITAEPSPYYCVTISTIARGAASTCTITARDAGGQ